MSGSKVEMQTTSYPKVVGMYGYINQVEVIRVYHIIKCVLAQELHLWGKQKIERKVSSLKRVRRCLP